MGFPKMRRRVVVLLLLTLAATEPTATADGPLRAVIIGADTSHVVAFTDLINSPDATGPLARVQVVAAYPGGSPDIPSSRDRVPQFTEHLRSKGVAIVDSIEAAKSQADAFLLESVDGRVHLEQFRQIACGKPVFVDKPAASSTAEFVEMMAIARETNTPFFSASGLRFCEEAQRVATAASVGSVLGAATSTPFQLEPHHRDLYWYGIHGVEALSALLGPGCESVVRRDTAGCAVIVGTWKDGRQGTVWALKTPGSVYSFNCYGDKGVAVATGFSGYGNLIETICQFFLSRQPPVAPETTREVLAFMDAAEQSLAADGKPILIANVIRAAEREAASRRGEPESK